jgi:tetrahydromethanopterin S-methyltransferase subunit B
MTTPQNELYNISCRVSSILAMIDPADEDSIFQRIEHIEEEIKKIDKIQDQLALIIKLLGKNE